jgi:hypothetical protein
MDSSSSPSEQWAVYESNVQSYRSNSLSSQSILLAVEAIVSGKNSILTVIIAAIGLFQLWCIWYGIISIRTRIVDYFKYSMKFGINELFDKNGNLSSPISCPDRLDENTYATNATVRKNIKKYISKKLGERKKFKNLKMTRIKLDIILPISITIIWILLVLHDQYSQDFKLIYMVIHFMQVIVCTILVNLQSLISYCLSQICHF